MSEPEILKWIAITSAVFVVLLILNATGGLAAVVVAAGMVAVTGSGWPDLIVAFAIAGLFLHSAWVIIRDARRDIAEVRPH